MALNLDFTVPVADKMEAWEEPSTPPSAAPSLGCDIPSSPEQDHPSPKNCKPIIDVSAPALHLMADQVLEGHLSLNSELVPLTLRAACQRIQSLEGVRQDVVGFLKLPKVAAAAARCGERAGVANILLFADELEHNPLGSSAPSAAEVAAALKSTAVRIENMEGALHNFVGLIKMPRANAGVMMGRRSSGGRRYLDRTPSLE